MCVFGWAELITSKLGKGGEGGGRGGREAAKGREGGCLSSYCTEKCSFMEVFVPSPFPAVSSYLKSVSKVVEGVSSNPKKDHEKVSSL